MYGISDWCTRECLVNGDVHYLRVSANKYSFGEQFTFLNSIVFSPNPASNSSSRSASPECVFPAVSWVQKSVCARDSGQRFSVSWFT